MLDPARGDRPADRAVHGRHPGYRARPRQGRLLRRARSPRRPRRRRLCRAEHSRGDPVPVLVRWSNGAGTPAWPDGKPDIRGMAVKFQAPGGDTDLLGQTSPRFPTDDPADFVEMAEPARPPAGSCRSSWPGTRARSRPLLRGDARASALGSPVSYAEIPYYPIHAYGWLDADGDRTWVRYELHAAWPREADRLGRGVHRPGPAARRDRRPAGARARSSSTCTCRWPAPATTRTTRRCRSGSEPRDFVAGRVTGDRAGRRTPRRPTRPSSSTRPGSSTASSSPTTRSCATAPRRTRESVKRRQGVARAEHRLT